MHVLASVTRFGEISPLWRNVKHLAIFWRYLCSIWQNFKSTFAKIYFWENLIVVSGQILKTKTLPFSHTGCGPCYKQ